MTLLSWVYALTFWVLVGCLPPGPWPKSYQDGLASTGAGWDALSQTRQGRGMAGQGVAERMNEDLLDGQG